MSLKENSVEIGKVRVTTCVFTASDVSHQGHKSTLHFFFCQKYFISFFKFWIVRFVFILFCAQSAVTDWSVNCIICWSNLQFSSESKFLKSKQKAVYYLLTKTCHLTWIYYFYLRPFSTLTLGNIFSKTGTASNKWFYQSAYCNANEKPWSQCIMVIYWRVQALSNLIFKLWNVSCCFCCKLTIKSKIHEPVEYFSWV